MEKMYEKIEVQVYKWEKDWANAEVPEYVKRKEFKSDLGAAKVYAEAKKKSGFDVVVLGEDNGQLKMIS